MKTKLIKVGCCALLIAPTLATADAANFRYIDVGYVQQNVDVDGVDGGIDFDGYGIGGKYQFYENFYATASYADVSLDENIPGLDVDLDAYSIGLGYVFGQNEKGSFFGEASYVDASGSASGGGITVDAEADGYGIEAGFRMNTSERSELNFSLVYTDTDIDDDFSFFAEALYDFFQDVSGVVQYSRGSDTYVVSVGVRFNLPY